MFCLRGVGGVFWVPLISICGRAPILLYTTIAGTLFTLGCILAPNFSAFYGLRTVQGFFSSALYTVGLAFIQDMFFFHERAKKIGIWTASFTVAPYMGPLLANYILWGTKSWRVAYWMVFELGCLAVVLILLFIDEPWYRRDIEPEYQPPRGHILLRLIGIWQFKHHTGYLMGPSTAYGRLMSVVSKPVIILIMIY